MTEGLKEFMTPNELAELLQVNVMTVYRMVRRGAIACHQIGRAKRFRRADVEDFLAQCRTITHDEDDEAHSEE